ncbi:hypothetical protein DRW42_26355 [Pedobacter miscanthi]|uniref:Adhesin domain-containing protein n=2 Tax=Pedobacter miscanthi TaxID=2259170 RepID=A0A366KLG7_9SPHI|nr:hypothetical protein DRW42_26355 [Pedobacter miscanthi]
MVPGIALSQTKINKAYPVKKGDAVVLNFDYPKVIHISSWDKNEIGIEAIVKINGGENDSAFTLHESTADGTITIQNKLDMDKIPEAYYVKENGIKTRLNSKADLDAYIKEKSGTKISSYQTKDIEITINIKLPANINTEVRSVYGIVEIKDFKGPIKVDARYGGIDASIGQSAIGKIKLTNRYGKIYTDMVLKPTELKEENFFTSLTAAPGVGPSYDLSSSYGNIYLRNQ